MNTKEFFSSKGFRRMVAGLVGLFALILAFGLGLTVGFRKADFAYRWAENYNRNFAGPKKGFLRLGPIGPEFTSTHGIIGTVLKVEGDTVVIKGDTDSTEKTIVTDSSTSIRKNQDNLKLTDIKPGDHLVIIGSPTSQGQIQAKFIRVFSN